jgi:hypothetical protein
MACTATNVRLGVRSGSRGTQRHGWGPVPARSRVHACARGCAQALELARRAPGFGFGHTAARWRDAAGCAGDHRWLDRGGEPERRCSEAGANHVALVSGRKGPTLTLQGEYVYASALACAATPRLVCSKTNQTRGKAAWRARVGEGGDTCKKFPSMARGPA